MRDSLRRLASDDGMPSTCNARRVQVELIDGSLVGVDVDRKALGHDLLDKVCESLDVEERDYFGLQREEKNERVWLDLGKRLSKTFKNDVWFVRLSFKFYPPEPSQLRDDTTRYQLMLAVRRDFVEERLSCSSITCALLMSYIMQSELGDYDDDTEEKLRTYLYPIHERSCETGLTQKITQLYQNHKGLTPAESELNYLENAKKLPMYGAELHEARDSDNVRIILGVCANGVTVYRESTQLNRFPWTKILKISYDKHIFMLELRPTEFDDMLSVVSFRLPSARASKQLWKSSVEQHMFFRRAAPVVVDRIPGWKRFGSRRFSCRRTLSQIRAA